MNFHEPLVMASPELSSTKKVLGLLIITNCVFYGTLIPIILSADTFEFAVYSIAIILGYNILEALLFFGCQSYNWPCTLTFRIIWVLHDFACFITFVIAAPELLQSYEVDYSFLCAVASCAIFL